MSTKSLLENHRVATPSDIARLKEYLEIKSSDQKLATTVFFLDAENEFAFSFWTSFRGEYNLLEARSDGSPYITCFRKDTFVKTHLNIADSYEGLKNVLLTRTSENDEWAGLRNTYKGDGKGLYSLYIPKET